MKGIWTAGSPRFSDYVMYCYDQGKLKTRTKGSNQLPGEKNSVSGLEPWKRSKSFLCRAPMEGDDLSKVLQELKVVSGTRSDI